ncbi:hypothetical protein F9C07_1022 [Aspergillus flavus]|uniref:Uncharacterized protein n=1 Tax=Aspergillus flavus (strain ATCC 200026 / FGSC A1120 / IAM 13836 / NRRL 3357 / JCM 12722 / SRRC 167) TaxID=332952 RepID=A0A7U2MQJ0_ASPFN|nr:hypothetical protein F9C07_1022 [Aspergillus flavus]
MGTTFLGKIHMMLPWRLQLSSHCRGKPTRTRIGSITNFLLPGNNTEPYRHNDPGKTNPRTAYHEKNRDMAM